MLCFASCIRREVAAEGDDMNRLQQPIHPTIDQSADSMTYLRQMLGELRLVAKNEGADMLCYLIEMAYVEAGDIQAGRVRLKRTT
jgi:hypothetical protein